MMILSFLSTLSLGFLADIYGRKRICILLALILPVSIMLLIIRSFICIVIVLTLISTSLWGISSIYRIFVAESLGEKSREVGLGIFFSIISLFNIFSPIVGGIIITYYGYSYVFTISSILAFISLVPLLFTKETLSGKS